MSNVGFSDSPGAVRGLGMSANPIHYVLHTPLADLFGVSLVFLAALLNQVNVQVDKDTVALDLQVMLKLTVIGLGGIYGAIGFLNDPRVRRVLFSFPAMWMMLISGFYLLAVVTSIDPVSSLASTGALICIILMTIRALVQIGVMPVIKALFFAMTCFLLGSWFAYFLVPSIGVFSEPISEGRFAVRMGGLSHPNTLGQYAAATLAVGTVLYFTYRQRSWVSVAIILTAIGALVYSYSRTAIVAALIALAVAYRHELLRPKFVFYYLLAACLLVVALFVASTRVDFGRAIEQRMAGLTKSGDTSELTSFTGRAAIWGKSAQLIAERPATGYGAATSKYLLSEYSSYTHNLVLNVALSTGIFGGLAAALMLLTRLIGVFARSHPMADAIVVVIIVNGVVENVMFSFLPGLPTMIWIVGLTWWQLGSDPAVGETAAKRIQGELERAGAEDEILD